MRKSSSAKSVFECPVCARRVESQIRIAEALCRNPITHSSKVVRMTDVRKSA
jgi:DNA replicative helicase MCM subunit Mcm2 (Cdc46/Mcm family)